MKPITKEELAKKISQRTFPNFVIQAFNECIKESRIKNSKTVYQDDVVKKIIQLATVDTEVDIPPTRQQIFDNHWLDVEDHYRQAGWTVTFSKPGFNESGSAYFTFS